MRIAVALALSFCAVAAFGQEFHEVALTVGDAGASITAMRLAARESAMRPSPNVVAIDRPQNALIIPISGNTPGNFGTYFRSDVTIANLKGEKQYVAAAYLRAGVDNTTNPVKIAQFDPGSVVTYPDFVGTTLQKDGLGALFIYASDQQGNPDSTGKIDAYSRIWTPQPGSTLGQVSQNFDAVDPFDLTGNGFTYIIGLRQDIKFRSNVGIVNFSAQGQTWTVFSQATGKSVALGVPPYSVIQTNVPDGSADNAGFVQLSITTTAPLGWTAYGTTNDNTTGDGWVSRAKRSLQ